MHLSLSCLLPVLLSAPTYALLISPRFSVNTTAFADLVAKTDILLFYTKLPDFVATRELAIAALASSVIPTPPNSTVAQLDWASDGCSSSPDNPFHFPFLPACYRHDFGYRNYQNQLRWNEVTREKLDNNLYNDLKGICKGVKEGVLGLGLERKACEEVAEIYFDAVRVFGGSERKEAIRQEVDQQVEKRVGVVEEKLWRLVEGLEED